MVNRPLRGVPYGGANPELLRGPEGPPSLDVNTKVDSAPRCHFRAPHFRGPPPAKLLNLGSFSSVR